MKTWEVRLSGRNVRVDSEVVDDGLLVPKWHKTDKINWLMALKVILIDFLLPIHLSRGSPFSSADSHTSSDFPKQFSFLQVSSSALEHYRRRIMMILVICLTEFCYSYIFRDKHCFPIWFRVSLLAHWNQLREKYVQNFDGLVARNVETHPTLSVLSFWNVFSVHVTYFF